MDSVAGHALTFGNGRMFYLTGKFGFVMTFPAKIDPGCREKLHGFCSPGMWFCVAGYASPGFHHGMNRFPLHLFLMASGTDREFIGIRNSNMKKEERKNDIA